MKIRRLICLLTALVLLLGAFALAEDGLNAEGYQSALEMLTARIRWAGTEEERAAAKELAEKFQSLGCAVDCQSFPFAEYTTGKQTSTEAVNVIAVKPAGDKDNGDILILSAHLDSKACTTGANDNASGTAMLLELARVLKDVDSDTEIRFIAFSAEEEGLRGSAYYVSTLTEDEKSRIVGDIQMDMIGHYMSDAMAVKTLDGRENFLSEMLTAAAEDMNIRFIGGREAASDHASFAFAGIPSVLITQSVTIGAENHRFVDNLPVVDAEKAVEAGRVVEAAVRKIASADTPSLRGKGTAQAVKILDSTPILFGVEKTDVEVKVGASASFEKQDASEYGYDQYHYLLSASWFGWDALDTDFVYRDADGLMLDRLFIRTEKLGLSDEALGNKLTEALGEPVIYDGGQPVWGSDSMAKNPSLRQYQIEEMDGQQVIEVISFIHTDVGEDIQAYDFARPVEEYAQQGDERDRALLEAVHKVVPPEDTFIRQIVSWTDGYSYILGACLADDLAVSDSFTIRMDKNDFFDSDGKITDDGHFLATAVHEYCHALTLNAGQIKLDAAEINYNDPAIYKEDSYLKAYYDRFYADGKLRDFYEHPEDHVSEYGGTGGPSEDIAEAFMQFVVSGRQMGDSLAAQKVNFFYDYPEFTRVRDYVRANFGYPTEE